MGKKQDERLAELIAAFQPKIRAMVEEIIEEKLRLDPHALDGIETAEVGRPSFLDRSIKK